MHVSCRCGSVVVAVSRARLCKRRYTASSTVDVYSSFCFRSVLSGSKHVFHQNRRSRHALCVHSCVVGCVTGVVLTACLGAAMLVALYIRFAHTLLLVSVHKEHDAR
jgi:hypothetical protein